MKVEPYRHDKPWQARARKHQSDFRESLGLECVPNPPCRTVCYGNIISDEDAAKGYIYFEGFREDILKVHEATKGSIATNLLRSEHIPYNLFYPMRNNPEALRELFVKITGKDIADVTGLHIEYAPSPIEDYLEGHTAFDTYISYRNSKGEDCGIGIEVKYTEMGYKMGGGEKKRIFDTLDSRYHKVTQWSNAYDTGSSSASELLLSTLSKDHFRQIWRNHMLGLSMIRKGDINEFLSIHLYPSFNEHFIEVVPQYTDLLSERGRQTFTPLTFEELFKAMQDIHFTEMDTEWKDYLQRRYTDLD